MMVSRDSAQQFYPREKLVSADCDHSQRSGGARTASIPLSRLPLNMGSSAQQGSLLGQKLQ